MKNSITFYTGDCAEVWSPLSLLTGVGGSQADVIYLAKMWKELGYDVTVYSNIKDKAGIYDGIQYIDYHNFDFSKNHDILILWREITYIDMPFKAKKIFLDLHDIPEVSEYTQERLNKIDLIFAKSLYQRQLLNSITNDNLFVVITNGYDTNHFSFNATKDKNKLIYASSFYRGLEQMLTWGWPVLKKNVPDAKLGIYYGWNHFDAVFGNDPEKQKWKAKMCELMSQDGIEMFGRVRIEEIAAAFKESNILYYPCTFQEMDCNTVRQAAVCGCIPFTSTYSALNEHEYSIKFDYDFKTQNAHEKLANLISESILNNKLPDELGGTNLDVLRYESSLKAQAKSWQAIAKEWTKYSN